jgi:NTF2-related export protein 1/2
MYLSIEIATRAADHFTRIYYTAYDSDTRLADLPHFYRPSSSLTWNGKPFQGTDGLKQLVSKMPMTKHEVQSFDCHPIPG